MAYEATGLMTMFPVYLSRYADGAVNREDYDIAVAGNETNLNQNFDLLFAKLQEIETYLANGTETE